MMALAPARSLLLAVAALALPSLPLAAALSQPASLTDASLAADGGVSSDGGVAIDGGVSSDGGVAIDGGVSSDGGGVVEAAATASAAPSENASVEAAVEDPASSPSRSSWLGQITSRGEVAVETRLFRNDHAVATRDRALALFGRLEWRRQHAPFEEKVRGYGRADHYDRGRSTMVLEEAWVQFRRGRLRLRLGADLINWTATEAFHPADVINARNLDSDLENLEKVGEPMAALQVGLLEGMTASFMFMPVYSKTLFPSPRSRLAFGPGVDLRRGRVLVDRQGQFTEGWFGPQAAVRLQQVLGGADISVFALEHMDRLQPLVALDGLGAPVPLYLTVRQVGGTYQHVLGPLIVKLEAAQRWFRQPAADAVAPVSLLGPLPERDHGTLAVGLEYGIPHTSGGESTLILEGQGIVDPFGSGLTEAARRQLSPFQRDLFGGLRVALNDEDGKELVVGGIIDLERPEEMLLSVAYQQRLGETFSLRVGLRIFAAPEEASVTGLIPFRDSDHLRLTLTRHF